MCLHVCVCVWQLVPLLIILIAPGGSLILPVIMRMFPVVLPSSFRRLHQVRDEGAYVGESLVRPGVRGHTCTGCAHSSMRVSRYCYVCGSVSAGTFPELLAAAGETASRLPMDLASDFKQLLNDKEALHSLNWYGVQS